jgi:glycosyltransferase involved in cell wall biosynthesis
MSRRQDMKAAAAPRMRVQRPKLAFYVHSMVGGGAERVFALLASGFAKRGYRVDLVMNRAAGPHMAFVAPEVRVVSLDRSTATALPALMRYLRRERPDCLVAGLLHNNMIAALAARLTGTPLAVTIHGIMSVHKHDVPARRIISKIAHFAAPLVFRSADAIGVVSEAARRDIPYAAKRPDKFHVVPNPVDTEHFSPQPRPADEEVASLPEEDGSPLVLALGRFEKGKNFALLIEAMKLMQADTPVRLALLGEGPERLNLERQVAELGLAARVHMPGFVTDPAPWYRRAAVHAVTSRCEGFGNTIVEALATGTPVVVAGCVGAPRDLLCQGKYGTIVPADDAGALAASLLAAIRQPPDPQPLVERASDFSMSACLNHYETMLSAIRGETRPIAA